MKATLTRNNKGLGCTLGTFCFTDSSHNWATLENPWYNNQPNISCIPKGSYICERHQSPRYGECFQVKDVPGRTHILFHAGNWEKDTRGCILLGKGTNNKDMVTSSKAAVKEFMQALSNEDEFELEIK